MFTHELGKIAKDKITGFQGVLTARVVHLDVIDTASNQKN